MILSLQYLRAYAAFWVLLTHVMQIAELQPFGYQIAGTYGVDIFFILSGFIIYYTTKEESRWQGFAIKRIFRIYPEYIACFFLYWCFLPPEYTMDIKHIIQNIFMMPWDDTVGSRSLVVGQAWSTCHELYFYLIMGILLATRIRKKNILLVLALLYIIGFIYKRYGNYGVSISKYVYSLTTTVHLFRFCVGILLAMAYDKLSRRIRIGMPTLLGGGRFIHYVMVYRI